MEYANLETMLARVRAAMDLPARDPGQLSPLVLAYIGDTVYDLYVRTALVETSDAGAHTLHLRAAKQVCAEGQTAAYHRMAAALTEAEQAVFRRGRNAHMGTVPKHAAMADYRAATGLEALLGYLYLKGEDERLTALMRLALETDRTTEEE